MRGASLVAIGRVSLSRCPCPDLIVKAEHTQCKRRRIVALTLTSEDYILHQKARQNVRKKLSMVVVVIRVDIVPTVSTELRQGARRVSSVHVDKISICPHFNADQHDVDVL